MKFRRNAKMLGSILDTAPFASAFFLLVMFVMLGPLIYTPGLHLQLPAANDLPGTDKPTVTVAVDAAHRLYFANQMVTKVELQSRLAAAVTNSPEALTLVVMADKSMPWGQFVELALLARNVGIRDAHIATLPQVVTGPNGEAPAQP